MSPSWSDRLLVALRPDRMVLLRIARGIRPSIQAKIAVPVTQPSQSPKWIAATTTLAQLLQEKQWQRLRTDIVISQHFVRSALMPANVDLKNRDEEETFALHCLSQASGDIPGDWQLRFANSLPGRPKLICAIERALLDNLENVIATAGGSISSLRPVFVAAYDSRRKQLSKTDTWFAALEQDRCCLLYLKNGVIHHISNRRIFTSVDTELPALIEQEQFLLTFDNPAKKVFLATHEPIRSSLAFDNAWSVTQLPLHYVAGLSPHSDSDYGLALEAAA